MGYVATVSTGAGLGFDVAFAAAFAGSGSLSTSINAPITACHASRHRAAASHGIPIGVFVNSPPFGAQLAIGYPVLQLSGAGSRQIMGMHFDAGLGVLVKTSGFEAIVITS
jgi:hypothetical protein